MSFSHLVKSSTSTVVDAVDRMADDGHDVLIVASKLSLRFDMAGALRLTARPLRHYDVGDGVGGVRFPHDFPLDRPGTDVLLVGTCLPGRVPATTRIVSFSVGPMKKSIRVYGPRVYMKSPLGVKPGPAAAIVATPLRFDHVFGGRDGDEYEARNPIGCGFSKHPEALVGKEAYRLEPADLTTFALTSGCFAPIDCGWEPRRSLVGTYDKDWRDNRSPIPPRDRDPLFHSDALPEQRSPRPLMTPFVIEMAGLYGEEAVRLQVPEYRVVVTTHVERQDPVMSEASLVRVFVDADARIVELLYVARRKLPRKWEALTAIRVTTPSSLPDEIKFHEGPSSLLEGGS
ncbi:MAG: DUF2169 domain-containing protein [Polyangiaceae bacterium]|nr:DUF2169 domain-containing protein [Polyangiaceae bacterium]